jgi:hypothetical protein
MAVARQRSIDRLDELKLWASARPSYRLLAQTMETDESLSWSPQFRSIGERTSLVFEHGSHCLHCIFEPARCLLFQSFSDACESLVQVTTLYVLDEPTMLYR